MKLKITKSVLKMIGIVLATTGLDTIFIYFVMKLSKLEIPLSKEENTPQTFKSVLIDKNSKFYGKFNDCCTIKNFEYLEVWQNKVLYQCIICKRVFERIK